MTRRRLHAPPVPPTGWPAESGHDLRQSLQAAQLQAHALGLQARQQGHADWVAQAESMAQALLHCGQLLDSLLASLADGSHRPTTDLPPPAPDWQAIDLGRLLDELLHAWQAAAAQRGLWLRLDCPARPPASPARLMGDALWLRRVLDNLVANALAHTPQGGVTVAWQAGSGPGGAGTVLTVADTGPGLGQATPPPAGHGLGLLIVRRLCPLLGVSLSLHDGPAGGTVARLAWPLAAPGPG